MKGNIKLTLGGIDNNFSFGYVSFNISLGSEGTEPESNVSLRLAQDVEKKTRCSITKI